MLELFCALFFLEQTRRKTGGNREGRRFVNRLIAIKSRGKRGNQWYMCHDRRPPSTRSSVPNFAAGRGIRPVRKSFWVLGKPTSPSVRAKRCDGVNILSRGQTERESMLESNP
jgi:hypothetical protein